MVPESSSGPHPLPPFGPGCSVADAVNDPVVHANTPPPPISGGTLWVSRDGQLLVAADPDRDRLYFIDLASHTLLHVRELSPGDEPGRLVEDNAGRFHVALRSGHAVATLTREPNAPITRRALCELPRGLAYDAPSDQLYVACAEGKLVRAAADPGGEASRVLEIERDARDVLVRGGDVYVSTFRRAELQRFDASGALVSRHVPATDTISDAPVVVTTPAATPAPPPAASTPPPPGPTLQAPPPPEPTVVDHAPHGAWRILDVPGKGVMMLHQRAQLGEILVSRGGYGGRLNLCGPGIVVSSVTSQLEGEHPGSINLGSSTLAVDIAADPTGSLLAVAAPGSWSMAQNTQIQLFSTTGSSALNPAAPPGPTTPREPEERRPSPCMFFDVPEFPQPVGQATAVAFASADELAVFTRDPASLDFINVRTQQLITRLDLGQGRRSDTGHSLFHRRTGAGLACASCHLEGGDDAHVWTFATIGPRRTQTLRGGLLGTEPLHWNGDMRDFNQLVHEVFVGRMAADFEPSPAHVDALAHWIDRLPSLTAAARDPVAAERGDVLFHSEAVGCGECHTGQHLTDSRSVDVGTGALLQVPSLHG
ncbi:MAG: hypothetical protein ABW321_02895, partial [Polyangiales bacterium]